MSDAARERTPLEIEHDALLYLAAWSARHERVLERLEREGMTLESALNDLAALTASGQRRSPRLVVLERIVRAAARRTEEFLAAENAGGRQQLHGALIDAVPDDVGRVPGTDTSVIDIPERSEGILRLDEALKGNDGMEPADAYRSFATKAATVLALHAHEKAAPACDDTKVTETGGGIRAREVNAMFFSDRRFTVFEKWLDPNAWHSLCPWFFRGMDALTTAPVKVPPVPGVHLGGWNQPFDERVLLALDDEWTTCLQFDHLGTTSELITTYELAQPLDAPSHFVEVPGGGFAPPHPLHLVVDHGFLRAEDVQDTQPPPTKARLTLSKIVWFGNPDYDEWTSLACDTFWLDLAMAMADAAATTPP